MDICRVDAVFADPDRGGSASTGSQRVLVVEDENFVAAEMEQWLVEAGHEVVGVVSSAEAAIDLAEQSLPDIVIMDIRLAGSKDGVYAAQQIYTSLGIRSLFSSAHADDWTRLEQSRRNRSAGSESPTDVWSFCGLLAWLLVISKNIP